MPCCSLLPMYLRLVQLPVSRSKEASCWIGCKKSVLERFCGDEDGICKYVFGSLARGVLLEFVCSRNEPAFSSYRVGPSCLNMFVISALNYLLDTLGFCLDSLPLHLNVNKY